VAGYLGAYTGRGRGSGKMQAIFYAAENIPDAVLGFALGVPGLTLQGAARHVLEHVLQHEFFHLLFEATVFEAAKANGRNPGRSILRYAARHRINDGFSAHIPLEEAAANARAAFRHRVPMDDGQREAFLAWMRRAPVGYRDFEQVLDENGITKSAIEELMVMVFGKDAPANSYGIYLKQEECLNAAFRKVKIYISDPQDDELLSFDLLDGPDYPEEFFEMTMIWFERILEHHVDNEDREKVRDMAGSLIGSLWVDPFNQENEAFVHLRDERTGEWRLVGRMSKAWYDALLAENPEKT
jgi:hypothetical protein